MVQCVYRAFHYHLGPSLSPSASPGRWVQGWSALALFNCIINCSSCSVTIIIIVIPVQDLLGLHQTSPLLY